MEYIVSDLRGFSHPVMSSSQFQEFIDRNGYTVSSNCENGRYRIYRRVGDGVANHVYYVEMSE